MAKGAAIAAGVGLLGVVGALVLGKKNAGAAPVPVGATPAPPPAAGTGKYDTPGGPVMPLTLEGTVDREIATDTSVPNLEQLAASLSPSWPKAVDAIETRIAQLTAQPSPIAAPPPPPVVQPPVVAPPVVPPYVPPVSSPPAGPPPPVIGLPPVPGGGGVTTLPPVTIVGSASDGVPAWDPSSMTLPDVSNVAIPAHYLGVSGETTDVQTALNTWASQVGYSGQEIPLATDGLFGRHTQQATASFQVWANATGYADPTLVVDGLPGANTRGPLANFGDIRSGNY